MPSKMMLSRERPAAEEEPSKGFQLILGFKLVKRTGQGGPGSLAGDSPTDCSREGKKGTGYRGASR